MNSSKIVRTADLPLSIVVRVLESLNRGKIILVTYGDDINKRKTPSEGREKDRIFFIWLFALIGQTTCSAHPSRASRVDYFSFTVMPCGMEFISEHTI